MRRAPVFAALVGALCAAGCAWDAGLDGLAYACPDQECPGGLVCVAGLCQAPGVDAPASGCAGTPLFVERFEEALDPARWDTFVDGGSAAATGGALELGYTASGSGATVAMVPRFMTEGATITIDVDAPTDLSSSSITFALFDDDRGAPQVTLRTDTFDLIAEIDGDSDPGGEVAHETYQPQMFRFWRVRRGGGEVCFETSANGTTFDPFGCGSDGGVRAELRLALSAQNYEGDPQVVRFDDLEWCGP